MERKLLSEENGGHHYNEELYQFDCKFRCGCWKGHYQHGGPNNLDPFGRCPNNPKNKGKVVRLPWEP